MPIGYYGLNKQKQKQNYSNVNKILFYILRRKNKIATSAIAGKNEKYLRYTSTNCKRWYHTVIEHSEIDNQIYFFGFKFKV